MSTVISPASVDRELAALVGEANVRRADFEGFHFSINGVIPAAMVSPGTPEEVAAVLRLANDRGLVVRRPADSPSSRWAACRSGLTYC